MAIAYDQEVQLRISAKTEGSGDVSQLDATVEDLQRDLQATAEAAKASGEAQAQAAARLTAAKSAYDGVKSSLQGAQNEYRYLRDRSREAGAAQDIFAAQAATARTRVADLKTQLLVARSTMRDFGQEHRNAAAETRRLAEEQRRLEQEIRNANAAAKGSGDAISLMGDGMKRLAGLAGGMAIARDFVEANISAESLERTLTQMTGSAAGAAKETEWLKETANRLGIDVQGAARAYVNLTAATRGTQLEGQQTRDVFEAVAGAMAKLGRSSADTEGALQAVAQMVSKGTVQMEELRGQLGERLPGALDATAKAMGITTGELVQMVSSGNVLASDLLPKLAEGLNTVYGTGKINGTVAAWNRLKNSVAETWTMLGQDGGVMSGVVGMLDALNSGVRMAAAGVEFLGKSMGTTAAAIATFDLKHPIDSLRRWNAEIQETRRAIREKFKITFDEAAEAKIREFWGAQTEQAQTAATAAQAAGSAATEAGAKAQQSAGGWLAVEAAYSKLIKSGEQATALALKSADARKAEGDVSIGLAQAFGTETEKRDAARQAAEANARALDAVADARQHEADVARQYLQEQIAAAGGEANLTAEKLKAVQASRDAAAAKQSEAEKAAAAAQAAQVQAAALATSSAAVADNSARVNELKAAMEAAAATLAQNIALNSQGDVSEKELAASRTAAQQATALYRDALNDLAAARLRDLDAMRSAQQLSSAQLNSDRQIAQAQMELARARGDSRGVQEAQNKLRQIEIKMLEATAAGSRAEAKAILSSAEAKKVELVATGQLTPARQAEIDRMIASAKLKEIEAEKSSTLAGIQRELASELGNVARTGRDAGDGIADSYHKAADASDRLNSSIRSRPAERPPGQSPSPGGGGVPPSYSDTQELSVEQLKRLGKTEREIEDYKLNRKPEQQTPGMVNRYVSTFSAQNNQIARANGVAERLIPAFSEAFGPLLDEEVAKMRQRMSQFSIGSPTDYNREYATAYQTAVRRAEAEARKAQGSQAASETRSVRAVDITMRTPGGGAFKVQAADEQSANNLIEALKRASMVAS